MAPRKSTAEAARSRARILDATVDRASRHGLESVTVGALAGDVGMSKAGVVGPFGSREALLGDTLDRAVEVFREAVPALLDGTPPGPARVGRLLDLWIDYLADCPFPGGCFVTAASFELDHRPGPLRDRIRTVAEQWHRFLAAEITEARTQGLPDRAAPEDLATALVGLSMAANQEIQLLEDPAAPARARRLMRAAVGLPPA
ncbi:TetR/AcrR family transcriptional regulator [Nocardiopsis oceani]